MASLSDIAPKTKSRVMDLVKATGIDVKDWAKFSGGEERAASNPKYCYEWSFVEPGKLVVLNLWLSSMEERDGQIFQNLNTRRWGGAADDGSNPAVWITRAKKIDAAIQAAYSGQLPVRVIVCDGVRRDIEDSESSASRVKKRALDPSIWAVTAYNWETGQSTVTRDAKAPRYIDQFSIQGETFAPPEQRTSLVTVRVRDPNVRDRVRNRAGGKCELCGQLGFRMADGRIYIETHHVVPLSEGGADKDNNVAALCPSHHRQAHHGFDASAIRKALQKYLSQTYRDI